MDRDYHRTLPLFVTPPGAEGRGPPGPSPHTRPLRKVVPLPPFSRPKHASLALSSRSWLFPFRVRTSNLAPPEVGRYKPFWSGPNFLFWGGGVVRRGGGIVKEAMDRDYQTPLPSPEVPTATPGPSRRLPLPPHEFLAPVPRRRRRAPPQAVPRPRASGGPADP